MTSCSSLISWVIGKGSSSCDDSNQFGDLRSFCCLSCSIADIQYDEECVDDNTFVLASSKNHFQNCQEFVHWLNFLGTGCDYDLTAGTLTFSVNSVCCQTCETNK